MELGDIFAGKRGRALKKKPATRIGNAMFLGTKAGEERLPGLQGFLCQKFSNGKRFGSRDANNADAAAARRSRNGGYRILIKGVAVG